ncbi:RluA family pseudouridine synthase [Niallia sp. 01092]|uniref:RluA family pseudouridine synthase n=1 Tax=unclassified Niallia TaxID=2837522 RepID=UPI003FD6ACD1
MVFRLQWSIAEHEKETTIKDFLKEKEISKIALTAIKFKGGKITVNNKEENVRYILQHHDLLMVTFPQEDPSEGLKGENIPLNILYEDDFLLVVNKRDGMSSIPSREHPTGSLANGLVGYYREKGIHSTVHIVTRLDKDTSGLVLIAKHRHIHHLLSKQQKDGKIKRTYNAFAEGRMPAAEGVIEEPIGRKDDSIIKREVRSDGQFARTRYKVCHYYPDFTFVELRLDTGRTHQIRVHLSYLGHPLAGDDLYGGSREIIKRQALHCAKLEFTHPITYKQLTFSVPLPDDMNDLINGKLK